MTDEAGLIAGRVEEIRQRIDAACRRAGRDPGAVRLLPVSKTVPAARLRQAFAAGLRAFGENKVQEAKGKAEALADLPVAWSIVGHLQTNKAREVARFADEFQALDSLRVAAALERRLEVEDRTLEVLVQVNTSGEAAKFGLAPEAVAGFVRELPAFARFRVRGLMTLAVFSAEEERVRGCFRLLREIGNRLRDEAPGGWRSTRSRWACRAISRSRWRKARPSSVSARRSSARGRLRTATTGQAPQGQADRRPARRRPPR